MDITAEYLRERLDYNPETGVFVWKPHPDFPKNWLCYIGQRAGSFQSSGHRHVRMNGSRYKEHRLAWMHVNGEIPDGYVIDHINGDRGDNRIENLRLATQSENARNRRVNYNNKSGVKNVIAHSSGKWQVQVKFARETYFFGTFDTIDQAAEVAERERKRLHGAFCRAA